jgi:hypothetical protein
LAGKTLRLDTIPLLGPHLGVQELPVGKCLNLPKTIQKNPRKRADAGVAVDAEAVGAARKQLRDLLRQGPLRRGLPSQS